MSKSIAGLEPLEDFMEDCLPLTNGKPRSKRSEQELVQRYNLPVVKIGHRRFIDPILAAERLREDQLAPGCTPPRSPGRPRKT
jgi:hypothetical protein